MSLTTLLIVMLGGALGTGARYLISWLMLPASSSLPWGTMMINVTGSMLIGFFGTLTLASGRFPASEQLRLFVMVGVCGGYTTFSSFSLQTLDLLRAGASGRALVNVALSIGLCVAAVALGHAAAAALNGGSSQIAQISEEELG